MESDQISLREQPAQLIPTETSVNIQSERQPIPESEQRIASAQAPTVSYTHLTLPTKQVV